MDVSKIHRPATHAGGSDISEAREQAHQVLLRCATAKGFAASGLEAGYAQVWARDSAITALGAMVTGDPSMTDAVRASLISLGSHQSDKGLVPLNVNPETGYVSTENAGAVDPNLWFVLGHYLHFSATGDLTFLDQWWEGINAAIVWLEY